MKKFVVMSGGFHPFHAGHASLYQQAKEAFRNVNKNQLYEAVCKKANSCFGFTMDR